MKKEYISDVWQLKQKGHENFEFIDVAVNDDNLLFIFAHNNLLNNIR